MSYYTGHESNLIDRLAQAAQNDINGIERKEPPQWVALNDQSPRGGLVTMRHTLRRDGAVIFAQHYYRDDWSAQANALLAFPYAPKSDFANGRIEWLQE